MDVVIRSGYIQDSERDVKLTINEGDILSWESISSFCAGLGRHYENTSFFINDKLIGVMSKTHQVRISFFQYITEQLINQDIAYEKQSENSLKIIKNKDKEFIKLLKKVHDANFRFKQVTSIDNCFLYVDYYGYEGGGSYTKESSVAPFYIEMIEKVVNRKVVWLGYRSGGMGASIYEFKIEKKRIDERIEDTEERFLPTIFK